MNKAELRDRVKNAIILLGEGHTFKVGDLTFGCRNSKDFLVTGWTLCPELKNLTRQNALVELGDVKELFQRMVSASPELSDFVNDRQIEYYLDYDSGKSGLKLCSEIDGKIRWTAAL